MYELKGIHHRQAYRRGDLEAEDILLVSETYSTRKSANARLKGIANIASKKGQTVRLKCVGRGNEESTLAIYTGNTWIHENTGDQHEETYYYRVIKK